MPSRNQRRQIESALRKALAETRCPAHGDPPSSVKVTWSDGENGEQKAEVDITPVCCQALDDLA